MDDRTTRGADAQPCASGEAAAAAQPQVALVPVAGRSELEAVASLAREIWLEFYVPIIGRAQVEYMLERFQTADAIARQLGEGYEYHLVRCGDATIGYCAVRADREASALFLGKLYLRRDARGVGAGRELMRLVEEHARARGLSSIWLTVNRRNPTVRAYERMGFRIAGDVCTDIGSGFVLDDHRMEKQLARDARDPTRPRAT